MNTTNTTKASGQKPRADINEKTRDFSIRVIKMAKFLKKDNNDHPLIDEVVFHGTRIGASLYAGRHGGKTAFLEGNKAALHYAHITKYYIDLMYSIADINKEQYDSLNNDIRAIINIFGAIIKKLQENMYQRH